MILENIIHSGYKAYYTLACVIVVNVSVGVLYSFNNNLLHDIWNERVLVPCFLPSTNSTGEYPLHQDYT